MTDVAINAFVARWSATGTNLCLGLWEISYLGRPLVIDTEHKEKDKPMDSGAQAIMAPRITEPQQVAEILQMIKPARRTAGERCCPRPYGSEGRINRRCDA